MKKILSILSVFILALTLVGCNSSKDIKEVQPAEIQKKIDNKESFIAIVTQTTCTYCKEYTPIVADFVKKETKVDVVDVVNDKIDDEQARIDFMQKYAITGTPTTLFFKNGELKSMVTEVLTLEKLDELYNQYVK